MTSARDAEAFVLANTTLRPVPLAPELSVYTASEVTPLWQATEAWLGEAGVAVPFWSVPWAGGQALARWVLDHEDEVRGKRVVDFGCGGGVVALAAVRAGAEHVLAVDVDPVAVAATLLAARANGAAPAALEARVADLVDAPLDGVDVLLAGDVWYEAAPAARFARWMQALAARGLRVVTGDPGRSYVPAALVEIARYEVPVPFELESAATRTTRILVP